MPRPGMVALPVTGSTSTHRAGAGSSVSKVRVLDIFAGAGGLSMGLEQAGFDVVAGAEWDRDACETFAKAHPTADVAEGDVNAIDFRRWRSDVDVLVGGPPCQPWSTGGKRLGADDPRDGWPSFLRALRETRPEAFVAENVSGFGTGVRRRHFNALVAELEALAFRVTAAVLNAADYGVPQRRRRLLIVGVRAKSFVFPPPSFGAGRSRPWTPAGAVVGAEAIGRPNPSIVTYARCPDLRPNPYDGHIFNGGGRPIDLSRPAPTLLASMGGNKTPWVDTAGIALEYHQHLLAGGEPRTGPVPGARRITVEEAALLQTFPPGMHFAGRRSSCYRQIGNAVPPLLAEAVGKALLEQI
jgi:DNA (cytosine-5)-methyltransferase 1